MRRGFQTLTILMYHGITSAPLAVYDPGFLTLAKFRRHIRLVTSRFNVLSLQDGIARLDSGTLPRHAAALTFDDGFQNNYDLAFPLLREFNLPATIFPVSSLVGTSQTTWFSRVHMALLETTKKSLLWEGSSYRLGTPPERARALGAICRRLKAPSAASIGERARGVSEALGVDPDAPVSQESPFRILSRSAIDSMLESGLITLGAHTATHPILANLPQDEQEAEITGSLEAIADFVGRPCRLFAYPNGLPGDYTQVTMRLLEQCGVTHAVTAVWGLCGGDTPPLKLPRCSMSASYPIYSLRNKMIFSEVFQRMRPISRRGR